MRFVSLLLISGLFVLAAAPAAAQQTNRPANPDSAAKRDVRLKAGDSTAIEPAKRHRFDAKFWIPWAIATATTISAVEVTQQCLHNRTCGVSSPAFGGRPSRLKMYSIVGAVDGANFYVSWRCRRDGEGTFWWLAPPVALGGATGYSLRYALTHQHPRTAAAPLRMIANMPASEVVPFAPAH